MKVIKRDMTEADFDRSKIINAINKANNDAMDENPKNEIDRDIINAIVTRISDRCRKRISSVHVEEIQDMVETELMKAGAFEVAKKYIIYRNEHKTQREIRNTIDKPLFELLGGTSTYWNEENSNKNSKLVTTQRDYMAGIVSKDLSERYLLPKDVVEAHREGILHFHDEDYFAQKTLYNCCLINLDDMLQNGTVISGTQIDKPHSFATACTIATQVISQVASSSYGGQSVSLAHLAPFVDVSRKKITADIVADNEKFNLHMTSEQIAAIAEERVLDEIKRGVQTIQYQVITLMTTNGQAPFITVFMYLNETDDPQTKADLALIIEEVLKQRITGTKNEVGVYVTPAFPKLIYVLDENNITPGSEYWHLTELAAKCTAKRMVPDYISAKIMKELKNGDVYPVMGCRSALSVDTMLEKGLGNVARAKNYSDTKRKYYGRCNQGVVTINLPDIALSSGGDLNEFWEIFDERMELCHKALLCRHERLEGTLTDVAPILWQHGAIARFDKGEVIDPLLHDGYSTISLGYAGLWECVYALIRKKLTEPEGEALGLKIMEKMNEYTDKWKAAENVGYSCYGTPLESTTYKFATALRKRFGVIPGVTDKDYITNSYHVHVTEPIDAFSKLALEAKFQKLSPGGAISYVEVPNMQNNIPAVLEIMKFIYNNIMYAELNTKSDYCQQCGFDGEIQIVEDNGRLVWECPNCGNRDQKRLNVTRRTCGYLGSQFWNQGRTQEIKERVLHVD